MDCSGECLLKLIGLIDCQVSAVLRLVGPGDDWPDVPDAFQSSLHLPYWNWLIDWLAGISCSAAGRARWWSSRCTWCCSTFSSPPFLKLIDWLIGRYQLFCGWSGQVMIDQMYLMLFNLLFTSLIETNWLIDGQVSAVLRLVGPGDDRPDVPDAVQSSLHLPYWN